MNSWKIAVGALAALALGAAAAPASAEVITFDDLSAGAGGLAFPIANGYAGLDWSNFGIIDGPVYCHGPCGYTNGTVSAPNVAFNAGGGPASFSNAAAFTLVGFDITAAWNNGLNVTVTGKLNGVTENTDSFTVDTTGPTLKTYNWSNINEVDFSTSGGVNAGYNGGGTHIALDNVNVNGVGAVPEPTGWALMIVGLGGVGAALRSRRRAAFAAI